MKTTLVITTYNNEKFLSLVFDSLLQQTLAPDEVIIADDGSGEATHRLIDEVRKKLSFPLVHIWHEDNGFRKTMILNKAFAKATGDYIICIDGDIIMEKHFIEDHISMARRGFFVGGGRSKLKEGLTESLKADGYKPLYFYTKGVRRKFNAIRLPLLTPLFSGRAHFRGCNTAFWREDIIHINGYDERFIGYGQEDSDLETRLLLSGLRCHFVKFKAIAFHLYHKEIDATGEQNRKNKELRARLTAERNSWTEYGMNKYL